MTETSVRRLHIIGAGLLGTSVGMAAAEAGIAVTFQDVDVGRQRYAAAVIAAVGARRPDAYVAAAVEAPELVCIAVPPNETGAAVAAAASLFVNSSVMDLCSIKIKPLLEIEAASADLTRIVLSHPIAGSEASGPAGASAGLFRGRAWVLCGLPATGELAIHRAEALIRACGATIVRLTVAEHDTLIAVSSHLPQLIASALAACVSAGGSGVESVAGPALAEMTRTANSPAQLWSQITLANRQPLLVALTLLDGQLAPVRRALDGGTDVDLESAITTLMHRGRAGRALLAAKHPGLASSRSAPGSVAAAQVSAWTWVEVDIEDQPGALARLFDVAAQAAVNIEDVRINHAPHARTGTVSLAVPPDAADRLRAAVTGHAAGHARPELGE